MLRVSAWGTSDRGLARTHNEDCFEIDVEQRLYLVADGMGGHRHGEVASRLAVDTIRGFLGRVAGGDATMPSLPEPRLGRQANLLKMALRLAHDEVMRAIRADPRLAGMGTTVVALSLDGSTASVAHVGDSRAYRVRGGALQLLTQDHTWVNEQVTAGFLSHDQARIHPLKNVVTRALGGESRLEVDVLEVEVEPGDLYLLCSDGLTTMLSDPEIERCARDDGSPQEISRALVEAANRRGGLDNVTVVALRIEGEESQPNP
jgi:protein phosphatase